MNLNVKHKTNLMLPWLKEVEDIWESSMISGDISVWILFSKRTEEISSSSVWIEDDLCENITYSSSLSSVKSILDRLDDLWRL